MAERNALAELAEGMKRKVGDFSADESFKATLDNANSQEERKAAAFFREYALASRIVAELAKLTYSPAGTPENPLFAMHCLGRCRTIAEELK